MKRTDVAMIILIASMSVLVSYFVANAIVGDAKGEPVKVKTADAITSEVKSPDERVFGKDSINPTVEIHIGGEGEQPL